MCTYKESSTDGFFYTLADYKATYDLTYVDCSSVLLSSNSPEDVTIDYDSISGPETISLTSSWTDFYTYFSNTDPSNCPITLCSLYENDCTTTTSSPLTMGGSDPWSIEADNTVTAGYTQTFCVKCTIGDDIEI
jgi:hypothetical protein